MNKIFYIKKMESLTLDFFGEKVSIRKPKDLSILRIMISEKFGFSDTDATEILIYYANDNKKTYIINEEDYSNFKNLKLPTLYLDIEPNSRLYQSSLEKVKEETTKKSNEEELKLYQEQLLDINNQIDQLRSKKIDLVKKIYEIYKKQKKEEELKKQQANENIFNKFRQMLDNIVEKVKEITNEYVFKRFAGQEEKEKEKEKKEQVENIKKLTKDAIEEINNLSKIVIIQSENLIEEINRDEDDKIVLKGAARQLGATGNDEKLCDDCEIKNKHKEDHLSVRVVDPNVKTVYYGTKCKGCGNIIWDEEN